MPPPTKEYTEAWNQMCDLYTQLDKLRVNVMYPYPKTLDEMHKNSSFAKHVIKSISEWMKQQQMN